MTASPESNPQPPVAQGILLSGENLAAALSPEQRALLAQIAGESAGGVSVEVTVITEFDRPCRCKRPKWPRRPRQVSIYAVKQLKRFYAITRQ